MIDLCWRAGFQHNSSSGSRTACDIKKQLQARQRAFLAARSFYKPLPRVATQGRHEASKPKGSSCSPTRSCAERETRCLREPRPDRFAKTRSALERYASFANRQRALLNGKAMVQASSMGMACGRNGAPLASLSARPVGRTAPPTPDVVAVVCNPLHDWLGQYWSWNVRVGSKLKLLTKDPPLRARRTRNVGTGNIVRNGKEIFALTLEKIDRGGGVKHDSPLLSLDTLMQCVSRSEPRHIGGSVQPSC
jgi:hypothetical protein